MACTFIQAAERRANLEDSYYLHRFLSDYRDLISWIHDMKTIISADDLAKDVAGAESLLEKHQEHKVGLMISVLLTYSQNIYGMNLILHQKSVI